MNIYITILFELVFVCSSILLLFKYRSKLGLAPLYLLLGAIQHLLVNLGATASFNFYDDYTIYPGSVILFSSVLFAVLLIYIKEGVSSARTLIIGVFISNLVLTALFNITYTQELILSSISNADVNTAFKIDYKYFVIGTVILFLDFLLLVVLYQYLVSTFKKLNYFLILFISLFTVLAFDSIVFNLALFYGESHFENSLTSHLIGKAFSSLFFSITLYLYLLHFDTEKDRATFIANQERDIFSILMYRKKYLNLKIKKNVIEKKLTSQLETTLNNISDGFVSLDTNWCYTYVNKKAGEFIGQTSESLLGNNIWEVFPEAVGTLFQKACFKAVETQETQSFQEYRESLGKWFENRIYPSKEGVMVYFTDVTEHKKAEEQVIKSERYLNNIINNIGDPIFVKDNQSRLLLVNNAFCKMFNLKRDQIIGKSLAEDVPQDERESFLRIDNQVLDTGIENVNEERLTINGKTTRIISTKKSRFLDERGNKFLIGIIRDITERKKIEESIKESEEKFSKAFDSNVIGKAILNKDKKIIEINDLFANLIGFKKEDILWKSADELGLFNSDKEKNEENERILWNQYNKNGYVSNIELKYILPSGRGLFLLISLKSLQLYNEDHILITVLDITDKKNAEAELEKHKNQLEELVKIRTEEVNAKNIELQRMNKLFVGRELRMKELKNIIKKLQLKNEN